MVLVDTSVWVDHLRNGVPLLGDLLRAGEVITHPFVIGELACGNLTNRKEILGLLASLPVAPEASHAETLHLVEARALYGSGIGWVDAHLLAAALLNHTTIWTRDRNLQAAATKLGIAGNCR